MDQKIITIYNFHCNTCGSHIGQLVSDNLNEEEPRCPDCGSTNITYSTLIK